MDIKKLLDLGFTVTGGQIDRDNTHYGTLTADGAVLTPEGEALYADLTKKAIRKSGRNPDTEAAKAAAAKAAMEAQAAADAAAAAEAADAAAAAQGAQGA